MTGKDVYCKLMDLDLILQDGNQMMALYTFLNSIQDNHPALARLDAEIEAFKTRIERLVKASQGE